MYTIINIAMLKKVLLIILLFLLHVISFSQTPESFNCKFLDQFFNYIRYDHKERIKALRLVGGIVKFSFKGKKIKYENNSSLPDSENYSIIKKYDLVNLVDDPLIQMTYKTNVIVDTLNFFSKNCACLNSFNEFTTYKISNEWIINRKISSDTQLIRLANIYIEKQMLVIVLNSNRSPYYFGYFYFELGDKINPRLKKIKWLQPQYDIDNF